MKKLLMIASILLGVASYAQSGYPVQNISPDNARYRLFATDNIYTFLELDTSTGQIFQVQWNTEKNHRLKVLLSVLSRVPEGEEPTPGRFFLYPTTNLYTFILLDQVNGETWQVQWSLDADQRMVVPIYFGIESTE